MKSKLKSKKIVLIALAVVLVIATALIVCFSLPKGVESVKLAGNLTTTVTTDNLPKVQGGQCIVCNKTTALIQNQKELAAVFKFADMSNAGGGHFQRFLTAI